MAKPTIVHVWQQRIRGNIGKPAEERLPPIIIRSGPLRTYTEEAEIVVDGRVVARFVYSPDKPLDCGARLWLVAEEGTEIRAVPS